MANRERHRSEETVRAQSFPDGVCLLSLRVLLYDNIINNINNDNDDDNNDLKKIEIHR